MQCIVYRRYSESWFGNRFCALSTWTNGLYQELKMLKLTSSSKLYYILQRWFQFQSFKVTHIFGTVIDLRFAEVTLMWVSHGVMWYITLLQVLSVTIKLPICNLININHYYNHHFQKLSIDKHAGVSCQALRRMPHNTMDVEH